MVQISRRGRVLRIRSAQNRSAPPPDFEDFWLETLDELMAIAPDVQSAGIPVGDQAGVIALDVRSLGDRTVRCWVSGPRSDEPTGRPLLVTSHGYGGQVDAERVRRLARFGMDVIALDVRGFGLSRDAVAGISPYGYVLTGADSAKTSILRGAVCDYIQAYRAALEWLGRPARVTFQGFSFAGGLAVMAGGVLGLNWTYHPESPYLALPDVLALGVPTFGHQSKRLALCESGSGKEIAEYVRLHPERRHRVLRVLSYFDSTFFAPFVGPSEGGSRSKPTRILGGVGIHDPVVPPETVYAIYNAFPRRAEVFEFPCSHTSRPEEFEWVRWESAWIRETLQGSPLEGASHSARATAS
jgi:cephalosporin-C deacetylase-like acetyl esterase